MDRYDTARRCTISKKRQPEGGQAPVVQRIRIRYAKRGPLRFTSHRDFARAFERALRRAGVPIAFSQGFTPHPKISYASAAPTGAASEAEYLEIGLQAVADPAELGRKLDAALSPGLDILDAVQARTPGGLADRLEASHWQVELPGVEPADLARAVAAFLDAAEVLVERLTKQGKRTFDARGPVVALAASGRSGAATAPGRGVASDAPSRSGRYPADIRPKFEPIASISAPSEVAAVPCAILDLVVRQVTPAVRPDDVLSGLRVVADLEPPVPPKATRLAQGTLTAQGEIADPLAADRDGAAIG